MPHVDAWNRNNENDVEIPFVTFVRYQGFVFIPLFCIPVSIVSETDYKLLFRLYTTLGGRNVTF